MQVGYLIFHVHAMEALYPAMCVCVCCVGAAKLPEMRTIVDVHEAGNREPRYMHLCMHASHRECINWQGTGQQLASLE